MGEKKERKKNGPAGIARSTTHNVQLRRIGLPYS